MPQVVEQIIEVPKMAEQILDVLVPEMVEQLAKLSKTNHQDRIQQRTVEHIAADTPVPQDVEEPAEFLKAFSQDRVQLLENPAIPLAEKIVELPVIQTEEKTRQGVNACVQHVVNAVEVEKYKIIEETVQRMKPIIQEKINQETKRIKIPLLQFTDKVADIPVVAQRQICVNQEVQKTIEDLQLQYTDGVVDVPAVLVVLVPQVQVVEKAEIPQFQVADKVVDVPVVSVVQVPRVCAVKMTAETPQLQVVDVPVVFVVQAPLVQVRVVKKTVEDSQFQIVEKTAEAPQTQTIQVTQTSESLGIECDEGHELMLQGNDSVSVAKDVEDEANEVSEKSPDCMVRSSASGSMRQPHRSQEQQTVQGRRVEREKKKQEEEQEEVTSEQEVREEEEKKRAQEAREEERRAQEAQEKKKAQEAREEDETHSLACSNIVTGT